MQRSTWDALTLPEPADNSIGRQTDARCVICSNVTNDAWEDTDVGLVCHNCLACKRWWHLECLSAEERDTTELDDPNGRCAECAADRRHAVNRVLEQGGNQAFGELPEGGLPARRRRHVHVSHRACFPLSPFPA